jgi:hypothetical protein
MTRKTVNEKYLEFSCDYSKAVGQQALSLYLYMNFIKLTCHYTSIMCTNINTKNKVGVTDIPSSLKVRRNGINQ